MKKSTSLVVMLLLIFCLAGLLQAAEPQTAKGSKFVYYGFSGLSELGIKGSSIGGGFFFKDDWMVWASTGMSFKNEDPGGGAAEVGTNSLHVNLGIEYYILKKGDVAFTLSPTLMFRTGSSDLTGDLGAYSKKETGFGIGLGLSAEWFASESISLFGGATVGYKTLSGTNELPSGDIDYSGSTLGFLDSGSSLGICFYF